MEELSTLTRMVGENPRKIFLTEASCSFKSLCLKGKDICSVKQYQWFISNRWNSLNKEWSALIQVITNILAYATWIVEHWGYLPQHRRFLSQWSANTFFMKVTKNITWGFPGESTSYVVSSNPPPNVSLTRIIEKKTWFFQNSVSWTSYFLVLPTWTHCFHIWTLGIFHSMHDMLVF